MDRTAIIDREVAETVSVLGRCTPFQDVPPAELAAILPAFHRHDIPAHAVVWREGDPADRLWFALDGYLFTVLSSADGDQAVTQFMGPGQSFGEPALFLHGGVRITTVNTLVPTTLLSMDREPLLRFLWTHPDAMSRMLEGMSRMILSQSELFRNIAVRDVRGRVANQLLVLADEFGRPARGGILVPFTISQTTLAGLVGSTRESVNRALANLTALGTIDHVTGRILITDRRRLSALADRA